VQLGPIARARGVRLLALEAIDSTNDEARRLIETGERGPLWIVAARQTKGRGRLGREWISPPGNLYASFIFGDFSQTRLAPELGFVTGVAVVRALRATAGQRDFKLKWPNDMLFDGAKLGGILLEGVGAGVAPLAIIGVGLNVSQAPEDMPYPARALAALGAAAPSAGAVFAAFSDALCEALDLWQGGEGFAAIRDEWLRSASGLGETIRVALTSEIVEGRFDTIDAAGRLVLETADGRRVIEAGDVLIGPRAAQGARA
jgi:biotin-[acetyl-CoA-carboxylase] ligase BirA-like protein